MNADKCPKCTEKKFKLINLNQELYQRYPRLWALINIILLRNSVLYHSDTSMSEEELKKVLSENEKQEQEIDPREFIKIDPNCQYFRRNF